MSTDTVGITSIVGVNWTIVAVILSVVLGCLFLGGGLFACYYCVNLRRGKRAGHHNSTYLGYNSSTLAKAFNDNRQNISTIGEVYKKKVADPSHKTVVWIDENLNIEESACMACHEEGKMLSASCSSFGALERSCLRHSRIGDRIEQQTPGGNSMDIMVNDIPWRPHNYNTTDRMPATLRGLVGAHLLKSPVTSEILDSSADCSFMNDMQDVDVESCMNPANLTPYVKKSDKDKKQVQVRVQIEKQFSPKVEAGSDQSPLRGKRCTEQDLLNGADPSLISATKGLNDDTVASVLDAALGDLSHNSSKCTQEPEPTVGDHEAVQKEGNDNAPKLNSAETNTNLNEDSQIVLSVPDPVVVVHDVSNVDVKHDYAGETDERDDEANRDVADRVAHNQLAVDEALPEPVDVVPAQNNLDVEQSLNGQNKVGIDEDTVELSNNLTNNDALVKFFSKVKNISKREEERVGDEDVATPMKQIIDERQESKTDQLKTPVNPARGKKGLNCMVGGESGSNLLQWDSTFEDLKTQESTLCLEKTPRPKTISRYMSTTSVQKKNISSPASSGQKLPPNSISFSSQGSEAVFDCSLQWDDSCDALEVTSGHEVSGLELSVGSGYTTAPEL